MPELLALDKVTAGYGESIVLEDVSFTLNEGDSLALLGRNGVGKTSLLVTLMGLTRLHGGASAGPAATSRACRPTGARARAWAGCRRSATCSRR
jgi:branched-chain amino acid transport system ATP-binding protein